MNQRTLDVAVIGAGVIGLAAAYELARAGASVVVLERHSPGAGQSTKTGGGIRLAHGSKMNVELTRMSLPAWEDFEARFGVDPRYRETGHLFLAQSIQHASTLRDQADLLLSLDVPTDLLDGPDISARWTDLAQIQASTGLHCPVGGYLDHHTVMTGYQRGLADVGGHLELGVRVEDVLIQSGRVEGVTTTSGPFSAKFVVNAAGPEAGVIAGYAGLEIPFVSRRHALLIVRPTQPVPDILPWLIDTDRQVHLRPDGGGRALIGGFMGRNESTDPQFYAREYSADWARRVRVEVSKAFGLTEPDCEIVEGWAGLYPGTFDYLPVLEESLPGLITAAGFSGTGLMHAPAIGEIVADMVSGRTPDGIDISSLGSGRFSKPSSIAETSGF